MSATASAGAVWSTMELHERLVMLIERRSKSDSEGGGGGEEGEADGATRDLAAGDNCGTELPRDCGCDLSCCISNP